MEAPLRRESLAAVKELPVVLNRADAAELRRLPGVGAKRAEAIVLLRQRLGRFRRPNDLLRVKGIGPRTLERMLPHLVLD
jgi:competence protein ComEA